MILHCAWTNGTRLAAKLSNLKPSAFGDFGCRYVARLLWCPCELLSLCWLWLRGESYSFLCLLIANSRIGGGSSSDYVGF